MRKGYVSPSLMCVDLMNVQSDIEKLEKSVWIIFMLT